MLYWWQVDGQVKAQQQQIDDANREVEALASVIKEVEDYKAKKSELERKIGIINDLKLNQRGPVRVMDYISRALPELLWIDRMRMDASSIEIEGRAFNTNAVANFIENLDKVPEFEEPTLRTTEEQGSGIYKFVITFNYSFAPLKESGEAGARGTGGRSGSRCRRLGREVFPVAIKTGLEGKPWYYGAAIGVVAGGVIFGLGLLAFHPADEGPVGAGRADAGGAADQDPGRAGRQAQLPKFREEVRQLELELDKLLRILPARRNTPDLLRRIRPWPSRGTSRSRRSLPASSRTRSSSASGRSASISTAAYHNLALFFDRISRFSRIINIEDLSIGAINEGPEHTIAASFSAKTFVYKEPEPAAPATTGGPAGGPAPGSPASRALSGGGGDVGGEGP